MDEMLKSQTGWRIFYYYLNLPQLLEMTENNTCEQPHIQNKSPIQNCCSSLQYGFEFWQMWVLHQ